MQLSVIILNYNVRYFLELCVLSVQKAIQNLEAEIIVVDNNSSDDSCTMMKLRFPNIKLIENKENSGFPKGNNIAVRDAKGEYICILNPDTIVAEDTFEKVLAFAKNKTDLGIVGCKLIDGTGNFLPESKRGIPTPFVAFTKIFGLYKISTLFGKYYAQHLSQNQSGKVDILVGAFMVMKREFYNEIGGFDENCFMYADDIDLSYRALLLQKQNYYFHETTVIHYKGESTIRDQKYMKHFQEAMQFFYKKHFRKYVVFDFMMEFGSFIFSKVKKNQQQNSIFYPDQTVIFTQEFLNFKYGSAMLTYSKFNQLKINSSINYEIVFDTRSFSFSEIINFMNVAKAENITFRMYIPQSNFIIGSNHANDRGIITNLSKIA